MSVEMFQDRDDDYLDWVETHRAGYVVNVVRGGRGYARVHSAACHTIISRPPFTGEYIKICSTVLADLDQWALHHRGTVLERCGMCRPPGYVAGSQHAAPADSASRTRALPAAEPHLMAAHEWEIEGPDDRQRRV